ncbi:MAG: phage holin family protein [Candidatus Eremiobacteraeota bacterium]|nr:phage holin family protein [Candidatus Eremiobacteraeota bacterium]
MNGAGTEEDRLREQSITELLRRLSRETTLLVRQEVQLAQAELTAKGRVVGQSAGMFGAGTLLGLGAFGAITACIILALSLAMPPWLAALIVAVLYGVGAAVTVISGKRRLSEAGSPIPEQTAETLKEDVAWVKSRTTSETR